MFPISSPAVSCVSLLVLSGRSVGWIDSVGNAPRKMSSWLPIARGQGEHLILAPALIWMPPLYTKLGGITVANCICCGVLFVWFRNLIFISPDQNSSLKVQPFSTAPAGYSLARADWWPKLKLVLCVEAKSRSVWSGDCSMASVSNAAQATPDSV